MVDRTIPWGDPANAEYFTGEGGSDPPDGNYVVAETAAGTKLMEWDATASAWQVRGDVDASGQALTADSLDANSVSADDLQGGYAGLVRAVSGSGGVVGSFDPDSSSNAVQDAIDAINAESGEGYVLLPPRDIDVGTPITGRERIELRGGGVRSTVLRDTDPSTPMFKLDSAADGVNSWMGGFSCRTPATDATAPMMEFNTAIRSHNFGAVRFEFRRGSDILDMSSGNLNSSHAKWLYATTYNQFLVGNTGPATQFDVCYLNSDDSSTPEINLNLTGGALQIGSINKGGTACPVAISDGNNRNYFGVQNTRYEPNTDASINAIFILKNRRAVNLGWVHDTDTNPNFAVEIDRLEKAYIPRCASLGVEVTGDMFDTGGVIYGGTSGEITDNAGESGDTLSTDAITCLGDLTQLA
jgi:hypothetical protein